MNVAIHVLRYIIDNNHWSQVPKRTLMAVCYQCYKRTLRGIFTKKLFNGKKIFLFPNNAISSSFVYTTFPDQKEISALRQIADNNTIFLDVGANIGAYSVLLMDKVKSVYAFEAHPETSKLCKMNYLLNGWDESHVITALVGANEEPKYFSNLADGSPLNGQTLPSETAIQVKGTTLDAFVKAQQFHPEVNFVLKIDVEGFEYEVFQGAKSLLSNMAVRGIVFETFSEKNAEIVQLLKKLGYQLRKVAEHNMFAYRTGCSAF